MMQVKIRFLNYLQSVFTYSANSVLNIFRDTIDLNRYLPGTLMFSDTGIDCEKEQFSSPNNLHYAKITKINYLMHFLHI